MSSEWRERVITPKKGGLIHEFVLQLKGFRKTFATLIFWEGLVKYRDANVAMHMACKRMRHSTTGMTVQHYIENSDRLNQAKWGGYTPSQVLASFNQTRLDSDWEDYLSKENEQSPVQEWIK